MAGACWLDISKFAEAGYEEDEVDQIGWYTDWTELLQDKVQDVAQVDGAQNRGEAEKTLKWKKNEERLLNLFNFINLTGVSYHNAQLWKYFNLV